ncbi:glycosyltransferase [Candidatus Pacearchaeota archaeon]|nr:glycosyltransferase [Candidatus Pacearchaeota archaeon]
MKRIMWLFRTNLRPLEYYHKYQELEEFKEKCHDFYLLQGTWFLENDYFDEFVVWRLHPQGGHQNDILFDINGKRFVQRWVDNFNDVIKPDRNYGQPMISFMRGGFPEYDELTQKYGEQLGTKLYLGAGRRVTPQYGGVYDKILVEDQSEVGGRQIPFYKTCNPQVFQPLINQKIKYDLCWVCNFVQHRFKGQEDFIRAVGASPYLKKLRILHVGNQPDLGKDMCLKYGVDNITFKDSVSRFELNILLNQTKFGIMTSGKGDGCPRVITETLCSGTPLIIRDQTRLLDYYKKHGVITYTDSNITSQIQLALKYCDHYKKGVTHSIENYLTTKNICEMNYSLWKNE